MENINDIFYQMLNRIRKQSGMWLGTSDINVLKAYIDGYRTALMDLDIYSQKTKTSLFPLDFGFMHEFSKIKTNSYESTCGWANLILKECDYNHKLAQERFFEYLDEFLSLRAVNMKKAILTEENILANDNMLYSYRLGEPINISHNDISYNDEQYFCSGNFIYKKSPIYNKPQVVYIIELSNGNGFLCAVETIVDIQLIHYIFREEQLTGDKCYTQAPERIFGTISSFENISCADNPDFNKPIYRYL